MRIRFGIRLLIWAGSVAAFTGSPAAQNDFEARAHRAVAHAVAVDAYQGRGPEQTERFSRRFRLGRDGRVSVSNISGEITVTGGSGDEVSIEAVKRTRGDRSELSTVDINVDERAGRVDVRVDPSGRNNRVSVDFTITIPQSASLDVHSVSGNLKVTGVRGTVRAETVSGNVTTSGTPRIEAAKSVSGNIDLSDVSTDGGDLTAGSVSGNVRARGLKARGLDLNSVSGDVVLTDVACERLAVKSVSGSIEYSGSLARGGRYDVNSHSGTVRFELSGNTGFELEATSFSGSVRSDLPLTITSTRNAPRDRDRRDRGMPGRNSRSMHGTFGDGSATLNIRTFSGDVIISRR